MDKEMLKGKWSGWQVITPRGPHSTVPQPFIQDAARIIEQMTERGEIKKLLDCIEKLTNHISYDENPHNFNINSIAAELLHNLYIKYRTLGHLSDQEEMFRILFYDLPIATWAEIKSKEENTKALLVPGFRFLTDDHEVDLNCHDKVFNEFIEKKLCPYVPILAIKHNIKNDDLIDENNIKTYIFNNDWNPSHGTFVVGLYYKTEIETITYLSLETKEGYFLNINITSDNKLQIVHMVNDIPTVLYTKTLLSDNGNIKVLFSYSPTKLYVKTVFDDITTFFTPEEIFILNCIKLKIEKPLERYNETGSIRDFWYYPFCITDNDILTSIVS